MELIHHYFGLRHGESHPSSQNRICSSLAGGVDPRNGLTAQGCEEVASSTRRWVREIGGSLRSAIHENRLRVIHSPFSRTKESAEIFWSVVGGFFPEIEAHRSHWTVPSDLLRERYFGHYDEKSPSDRLYQEIWLADSLDPGHTLQNCESAAAVQSRVKRLVEGFEALNDLPKGTWLILVSHGDTLKIAQTYFAELSASLHQDSGIVPGFETGEIRKFR